MSWYFLQLPVVCAVTALLDLDANHIGQWMISRPIVLGPLLGAYLGRFGIGVWVGVTLELLTLDDFAMGHRVPLNAVVATTAALLLAVGRVRVALPVAFPAGLLLGFIFRKIEAAVRSWRQSLVRSAEMSVDRDIELPGRLLVRGICAHSAACAVFLYGSIAAAGPVLAGGWMLLPQKIQGGLDLALQTAPWLGLATLARIFRPR